MLILGQEVQYPLRPPGEALPKIRDGYVRPHWTPFSTACHWMTPFLFFTLCSHLMTPIFKMLSHLMTRSPFWEIKCSHWTTFFRSKCSHWMTPIFTNKWPPLGGLPFSLEWGVINFRKYLANIFWPLLFDDQKFYDPPPGATMLKKCVTPNARSVENMHFGAISLNKIFIKICSHPIISWFFLWPPISHEKILWTPSFSMPPHPFGRKW